MKWVRLEGYLTEVREVDGEEKEERQGKRRDLWSY